MSTRQAVLVATSDSLAVQAGLEILQKSGNAIDAAVATGAVLDVASQNDTGPWCLSRRV